jgi:microcompartment protein CcmL/EutN
MLKEKKKIGKKLTSITSFLVIILLTSQITFAEEQTKLPPEIKEQVEKQQQDQLTEKRQKVVQEAITALYETKMALKALDEQRMSDALASLEHATGTLEIILARDPFLELAPVYVTVYTHDFTRNLGKIRATKLKVENLLLEGRIQDARKVLNNLASEVVIKVTNIPLGTYPSAMASAAALAVKGDIKAAKDILQKALNTLVITQTIVPLPISNAQALLLQAEQIVNKTDRSPSENEHLKNIIKEAYTELKFAEILGYGTKNDFKQLYNELDSNEVKAKGGKSGKDFFDKIKTYLLNILETSQLQNILKEKI